MGVQLKSVKKDVKKGELIQEKSSLDAVKLKTVKKDSSKDIPKREESTFELKSVKKDSNKDKTTDKPIKHYSNDSKSVGSDQLQPNKQIVEKDSTKEKISVDPINTNYERHDPNKEVRKEIPRTKGKDTITKEEPLMESVKIKSGNKDITKETQSVRLKSSKKDSNRDAQMKE